MISYNEALAVICEEFKKITPAEEQVSLLQSLNRILSENISPDINLPLFDNSAMDGYAVVFSPLAKEWNITGSISAGHYKDFPADADSAVEIMTGSKVPEGFNTVVPVEDINISDNKVTLKSNAEYRPGMNIRKKGEDIAAGKILLHSNTLITSKEIAALASVGKTEVSVFRKIRTGVLTTGDELIDISETPTEDKIRASNLYSLLAAIEEINMESVNLGILKDDREVLKEKIKRVLSADIDILISTGGVSAGRYDLLKDIFIEQGIEVKFHKVNIKPGKPVLFGTYNNGRDYKLIFGLPGNPVSALVGFIILIRQAFFSRFGIKGNLEVPAVLGNDIKKDDSKLYFIRGNIEKHSSGFTAHSVEFQSSGNIAQMSSSDCLIRVEEDIKNPRKGDPVNCILI